MAALPPLTALPLPLCAQASQEEITRAYKHLASRYHPDRPKTGDPLVFARITKAYEFIHNPVNRALYDLDTAITPPTPEALAHIHHLRRVEAMQTLRLLFTKVHAITQHELALNGLVILHARYGELQSKDAVLDVTMQLQARVDSSVLIVAGGNSKSWLEGFYDPTEGGVNELEVVYKMQGALHRVTVADDEPLVIPREEDVMTDREVRAWEKAYRLRGVDLTEMKKKRNRRYAAYATIAAVTVGAAWYYQQRTRKQRQAEAEERAGMRAQAGSRLPGCRVWGVWWGRAERR